MRNGPYILLVAPPDYPGKLYRGRYVYEHHLVYWRNTGKAVPEGHTIHHRNEIKTDNRWENLELLTKGEHAAHHTVVEAVAVTCSRCGAEFKLKPSKLRDRQKVSKNLYCTRACFLTGVGSTPTPSVGL